MLSVHSLPRPQLGVQMHIEIATGSDNLNFRGSGIDWMVFQDRDLDCRSLLGKKIPSHHPLSTLSHTAEDLLPSLSSMGLYLRHERCFEPFRNMNKIVFHSSYLENEKASHQRSKCCSINCVGRERAQFSLHLHIVSRVSLPVL